MKVDIGARKTRALIASARVRLYLRSNMLRLLSSLVVALALFFSPIVMASGNSKAMAHAAAKEVTNAAGHCDGEDLPPADMTSDVEMSCASACAAVPSLPPVVVDEATSTRAQVAMTGHQVMIGIHPEGETPPPRITPEI